MQGVCSLSWMHEPPLQRASSPRPVTGGGCFSGMEGSTWLLAQSRTTFASSILVPNSLFHSSIAPRNLTLFRSRLFHHPAYLGKPVPDEPTAQDEKLPMVTPSIATKGHSKKHNSFIHTPLPSIPSRLFSDAHPMACAGWSAKNKRVSVEYRAVRSAHEKCMPRAILIGPPFPRLPQRPPSQARTRKKREPVLRMQGGT
jgi:hypothetical protein